MNNLNRKKTIYSMIIIVMVCFFSCSKPAAKYVSPDYRKPNVIAILPTLYDGNDTTATIVFRQLLYQEMREKKYCRLLELSEIDVLLAQSGLDYADYSQVLHLEKLFRFLNVDGLLYTQILELSFATTTEKVKAEFKLFTPVFYMVWEDEREVKRTRSSGGGCSEVVAGIIVDIFITPFLKSATRAFYDHELKPEMEQCIRTSLKTLP
jgi:hypothetical protein